jgi:hypothetical protein
MPNYSLEFESIPISNFVSTNKNGGTTYNALTLNGTAPTPSHDIGPQGATFISGMFSGVTIQGDRGYTYQGSGAGAQNIVIPPGHLAVIDRDPANPAQLRLSFARPSEPWTRFYLQRPQ